MKVLRDVPLISQHWNLDNWKQLSFSSRADAEYWQQSCCGILCLQEIATFLNKTTYSTKMLIEQGQKLGGYSHGHGWKHESLAHLAKELGLQAESRSLSVGQLKQTLDDRKLPIVSIKWAFDPRKSLKERIFFWKKYGGHLAVVTGYGDNGFYVNHTSKIAEQNWKARLIPFDKFRLGYTGRAIILWK